MKNIGFREEVFILEYAKNEVGQPVIYIVNYVYVEHNVRQRSFQTAAATLEDAEQVVGNRDCFEIVEQNMVSGEQFPVITLKENQELKDQLLALYKSGYKREAFEGLNIREPFQNQLKFPLFPEIEKARAKAQTSV